VYYAFHGPQGIQTRDYTLKPEFVEAIRQASQTAKVLKKIRRDLDIASFVDDRFIRQAAREFGYDYDARLKDYAPLPFTGKDYLGSGALKEPKLAGQVWVAGEKKVRLYKSIGDTFAALNQLEKQGSKVRVSFVHDRESGLKLFADKAWYVSNKGEIVAFLEKSKADQWAERHQGLALNYVAARKR
jgi:NitT/TauT family transport system substrate-binding protein